MVDGDIFDRRARLRAESLAVALITHRELFQEAPEFNRRGCDALLRSGFFRVVARAHVQVRPEYQAGSPLTVRSLSRQLDLKESEEAQLQREVDQARQM